MSAAAHSNAAWYPGQVWPAAGEGTPSLANRLVIELKVVNTGDRPIQIGSHFHFFEVNKYLEFDRKAAYGFRLAIAAGTAVRFEPGQSLVVSLIALGGERVIFGFNGLINGKLDDAKVRDRAFALAKQRNFKGI